MYCLITGINFGVMRNIISPLLFLFIAKASIAQTWKKADAFHNSKDSWIIASTVDDGGSYYVTGGFYDTLNLGNFHLVANDSADVFWAKYNNQGNVVWAKSLGGKGEDNAASILVDREGNLYLLCSFSDTTSIDGNYFVSKGEKDLLLIKCDSLGNVLHYNTWGTVYSDMWTSAFFFDNKIYAIGEYSLYSGSPPKHETIQLDNFSFTSNGNSDILIVEIDTICSIISAKSYGTGRKISTPG